MATLHLQLTRIGERQTRHRLHKLLLAQHHQVRHLPHPLKDNRYARGNGGWRPEEIPETFQEDTQDGPDEEDEEDEEDKED